MRAFSIPTAVLLCALAGRSAAEEGTMIEVGVDGRETSGSAGKNIPHDAFETRFVITPTPGLIRYRLVGLETDWNERSGDMFMLVRFLNAKGDQVAQVPFHVAGKSRGWGGSAETSTATDRIEKIPVPADAWEVTVAISSAGPATAVGTFGITNLHVFTHGDGRQGGRDLIGPRTSTEWAKGGTRPSMAAMRTGTDGAPVRFIMDDDVTGHADWRTVTNEAARVTPGETLQVQWQEFFCTGMGDVFTAKYGTLFPGSYRFEVQSLGYTGEPPGELAVMPIHVAPPWWRNPWYWAVLVGFAGIVSSLVARHLIRKKIERHLEQARLIADERLRIARDLHDDLGARLSHISLLGSHAMNTIADPASRQALQQITSMSRELVTSLSGTVWMLNSKNDHLDSLINYLCRMVGELCRPLDIRCRIDAVSPENDPPVSGELRHNVSMAVKEAVNNALKHSRCSEIRLKIDVVDGTLEIHIADDGIGLDAEGNEQGNGLVNIRQRMNALKGGMEILKSEEGGVVIVLRAPIG